MKTRDLKVINLLSIFSLILFNLTTCSPNDLENQILELKIKAITSVELSSLSFDELPSLYFLFDTLTTKRFESVYKNDPKKFVEFKKIHQYYGIKTSFYSLKLIDALGFDEFNAEELEVMSNKVNWSEQEITKFGFIGKDENGKIKFHDQAFADFFLAQYFHDNIFHPKGSSTDDEIELRFRLFFYVTANIIKDFNIPNVFIMDMINDQTGEIFNDQVRMIMKYKFNLLNPYLSRGLEYVEKISMIFAKDKEVLGNLWGIEENYPFFLQFFEKAFSSRVKELKAIAEKYFDVGADRQDDVNLGASISTNLTSKPRADNIFRGKNQILNVLYIIYEKKDQNFTKNLLDVTKYQVSDETLQKLNQTENFLDFVDSSSYSLTEKKEFFKANAYRLIGISWKADKLNQIFARIEKYFTKNEMKAILTQKDRHFNHTHLFHMPSGFDLGYVKAFFNLTRTYLNPTEIKEFLSQRRPVLKDSFLTHYFGIAHNRTVYEYCYNFSMEFLTKDELKDLIFNNKDVPFIEKVARNEIIFPIVSKILTDFYTKEEIQDMLMVTDDMNRNIIFWTIDAIASTARYDVAELLRDTFKGREDKLKMMFKSKDKYGDDIFEKLSSSYYKDRIQPFLDLAKEIFTEKEFKELYKIS